MTKWFFKQKTKLVFICQTQWAS